MRTRAIFRNSAWYYLDFVFSFISSLLLSILVARKLGPASLGFFNLVIWLTSAVGQFGSFGISTATRKYAAEHLGRGEIRRAREIVSTTLRIQTALAFLLVAIATGVVMRFAAPENRLYTILAVCSLIPYLVMGVFSQALTAAQDFLANVQAGLICTLLNIGLVLWSLHAGWGLVGVTGSLLISRLVDMALRWLQYRRKFPKPGAAEADPAGTSDALQRRMTRFYWQSTVLLLFNIVVWDRSEMLFLKYFSPITEVAFYSLAFNISTQLLNFPRVFSAVAGASLMVEYGRDPKATGILASTTIRYICLLAFPLLLGMAATSSPAIHLMYGAKYAPSIPVLTLLCLFTIPRAMILPVQQQMLAHERQGFLMIWGLITAVLTAGLDWAFIPRGGALGAAIANGLAQLIASAGIMIYGVRKLELRLRWDLIFKMFAAGLLMAGATYPIVRFLPALPAALICVPLGAAVYLAALSWTSALLVDDIRRLTIVGEVLPMKLRVVYAALLEKLIARPQAV